MIQYALKCDQGHSFESWFQSSAAFEKLRGAGHVTCAFCGSADVQKAIMAPRVTASRDKPATESKGRDTPVPARGAQLATMPDADMRRMMDKMRAHVEENSDYVGDRFASEARAMHLGDAPERSIYGEARADEAKSLIEDGVPVMPLPFTPTRKTN